MNRFCQLCIVLAVFYAVGYETSVYWFEQTRPWQPISPWGRIIFYYSFFTVLTNLLLAISGLFLLFKPNYDSQLFRIIRLDALVGVIMTALVYNILLRAIHHPPTITLRITNELLHVVVPVMGIVSWLIWGPYPRIDGKTRVFSCLSLLGYAGYIFIRGQLVERYPYPFINPLRIGYAKMLFNLTLILILFMLLIYLLTWIERWRIRPRFPQ